MTGEFGSASEADTIAIAARLAAALEPGAVLLLSGDLGAGKTAFVRGVAAGLGLESDAVTSPTFTLVHEYRGGRLPLIHVDLYRLDSADLDELGLDGELAGRGVVAIEWPERLSRAVPGALKVEIRDEGGDRRSIRIQPETEACDDRTRAPEHGQFHDHDSTLSTSGPRNRAPRRRNVSTSPLVTNSCLPFPIGTRMSAREPIWSSPMPRPARDRSPGLSPPSSTRSLDTECSF